MQQGSRGRSSGVQVELNSRGVQLFGVQLLVLTIGSRCFIFWLSRTAVFQFYFNAAVYHQHFLLTCKS